jgi:hypothetical protein
MAAFPYYERAAKATPIERQPSGDLTIGSGAVSRVRLRRGVFCAFGESGTV